ncbi:fimbrial protein [Metapseudomonas otitidis]|uniref:fimbrial protein n=1 Tax=Metapseudomonas otitidis TaxID=319939 RepID=UPI0013F5DCC1|nr:fimbrial protein [Pseudomonas otitidis]
MRTWLSSSLFVLGGVLGGAGQEAWSFPASCKGTSVTTTHVLPDGFAVRRDIPVGSMLYDTQGWIGTGAADITCGGPFQHGDMWLDRGFVGGLSAVSGLSNVYPSGVPGIGVRVAWSRNASTPAQMSGGQYMTSPRISTEKIARGRYTPANRWWIQLIKTGPIESGMYAIPNIDIYYHNQLSNRLVFTPLNVTILTRGCRLLNPSQNVPLGKSWLKDFKGVGSTAWPKDFDIDLQCDPNVVVSYRIDGLRHDDSTLKNTEGRDMAKGVGIELLSRHGASGPLPMGKEVPLGRTPAQVTNPRIPLTARYRQVDSTVEPGQVLTSATITLFYR